MPNLKLPEQSKVEIGIWGRQHERYIKQYHKIRYFNMFTSCILTAYLANIDKEATEMYDKHVQQFARNEGVTEQLKAADLIEWVRCMNNIQNRAREIVNAELIFT